MNRLRILSGSALLAVCLVSAGAHGAQLDPDPTGQARAVASAELALYQQRIADGYRLGFLGITDRGVIEKAVLGRSFLLYGPSAAFEQAEWTNGEELLRSLRVQLWFPVLSEARVLGAIMIERRENGSYEWAGTVYGGNTVASIQAFIEVARDSTRYRMSAMLYPSTGEFAILEDGVRIISMRPLDAETKHRYMDLARSEWLNPDDVIRRLQARISEERAAAPSPIRGMTALLYSDLVVRGRVLAVTVTQENADDVMPMWPTGDSTLTIAVARVQMCIDEVMRGDAGGDSVCFLVYTDVSRVSRHYTPGRELVCGLIWNPLVLRGMYYLSSDGRFERTSTGWAQPARWPVFADLDSIRRSLGERSALRVLEDADAIVVGKVVADDLEHRRMPEGSQYTMVKYHMVDFEVLKGDIPGDRLVVEVITSGDYWPDWREDTTFPQGIGRGRAYCFFLRRIEGGYTVLRGVSGAYEVRDGELFVPGRQAKIGLTVDSIRAGVR